MALIICYLGSEGLAADNDDYDQRGDDQDHNVQVGNSDELFQDAVGRENSDFCDDSPMRPSAK